MKEKKIIDDGTFTGFYGGKTDSGYKLPINNNMTMEVFLERFTINIERDIKPYFKLDDTLSVDTSSNDGCYSCGYEYSKSKFKSTAWTSVFHCGKCNKINVINHSDRMGGVYTDTVFLYVESKQQEQ
jgi:hypothetical protein